MMTLKLQIIIGISILFALAVIVYMIRSKKLELKYALSWMAAGIAVLVLDFFPELMNLMADKMGIASPVNMLFMMGFIFALFIIFILTIVVSRLSVRVKELAQELALYKNDDK